MEYELMSPSYGDFNLVRAFYLSSYGLFHSTDGVYGWNGSAQVSRV